MAMTDEKYC